ncbi:MAG TPA: hypothetical protein PKI32_03230, partial [Opitutales bacterium]|nr:hypothetical protein [Opitutales bacterium]
AEAEALRNAMLARAGNDGDSARWLLAGDTNDEPGGAVWKRLTSKGGASIGIDLRPADGRGEYWTYYFSSRDSYERIDILMASEAMSRSIPKDSPRICDDPAMKASDHRMLYTDLVFPDAGKDSVANSTDGESDGSVNSATPGE